MAELIIKGHTVLVDDEDLELVKPFRWSITKSQTKNDKYYVHHTNQEKKCISMHRLVMGVTDRKVLVDHINHDARDNRKSNLRICTKSQNCSNRRSAKGSKSKYLGVSPYITKNGPTRWTACISKMKKIIYRGYFDTEEAAALAYNEWAKEVHGEFANLNIIEQ